MKHKPRLATTSARYRNFVNKRDAALEQMLLKAKAKVADELRRSMHLVHQDVVHVYPLLSQDGIDHTTINYLRHLDDTIDRQFIQVAQTIVNIWTKFRKQTFLLTYAGEQQALNNAGITKSGKKITPHQVMAATYDSTQLGDIASRTYRALSNIRRKVMANVDLARMNSESITDAVGRALDAYPSSRLERKPRVLQRALKEADDTTRGFGQRFKQGFIDDSDWEEIVSDYKTDFVPEWRDPRQGELEAPVSVGAAAGYVTYAWELENEMTEDFVKKVRNGEHEGAKEKGITDFVWIAILDDRTDECCTWRDGLTTSEIEDKLSSDHSDDECDAITPPAHFNCRCRIVPATDDLSDVPESNEAEFEDWLNS